MIVGRCADYILKEYNPYRIFIYADMEYKQQRIMNNYKDARDTAYENIIKSDKKEQDFTVRQQDKLGGRKKTTTYASIQVLA